MKNIRETKEIFLLHPSISIYFSSPGGGFRKGNSCGAGSRKAALRQFFLRTFSESPENAFALRNPLSAREMPNVSATPPGRLRGPSPRRRWRFSGKWPEPPSGGQGFFLKIPCRTDLSPPLLSGVPPPGKSPEAIRPKQSPAARMAGRSTPRASGSVCAPWAARKRPPPEGWPCDFPILFFSSPLPSAACRA